MMERIERLARENEALRAEVERLRAGADRLLWNLAKCSTIACSKTPTEFNREWAKPALHEVNELAKEYQDLKAEVERLRKALEHCSNPDISGHVCVANVPDAVGYPCDCFACVARAALGEAGKKEPEPETCVWRVEDGKRAVTSCYSAVYTWSQIATGPEICPDCGKRVEVRG